nr:unnamed protein product [Digitaria exilis]
MGFILELTRLKAVNCFRGHKGSQHHHLALKSLGSVQTFFLKTMCESFSTYPRTYDLLHAWLLFSEIEKQGCSLEDLLIEMDRILRPHGYAIIRDKVAVINYIKKLLPALRWDDWTLEVKPKIDALSSADERVLILKKKLWNQTLQDL